MYLSKRFIKELRFYDLKSSYVKYKKYKGFEIKKQKNL